MQQSSSQSAMIELLPTKDEAIAKALPPRSLIWAYRMFWLTFFVFFVSTGFGKVWDRFWHATHRFETFWSPPHFFVFIMTIVSSILVATIAFTPKLRVWFGPSVRLPFVGWQMAGSLVILGGGLTALSITIMLDNFWHTAFGLDETQWSVPHCMLGWSWLTIILGFVAARLAFRTYRPLNWLTTVVIGLLILEFLCPAILDPFYLNYSPHLVMALKNIPIVRTEPSAQHMYRIYLNYGLTRQTSPLFIPLVAVFAGIALALLRSLDARKRVFLLVPLLWSFVLIGRDLYTLYFLHYNGATHFSEVISAALHEPSLWVPIPLFVAALVFAGLEYTSFTESRRYALAGLIFGICTFFIWHTSPWMVLLAIPAAFTAMLGGWIGRWIYHLLIEPTMITIMKFLLICTAQIPATLGIVDLFMRRTTP